MKMTNENQIVHHNKKKQTADPGESEKQSGLLLRTLLFMCAQCQKLVLSFNVALRPKTCMTDGKHGKRRY